MRWPFVRRHVAASGPNRVVKRRIPHPWLQHPVIEIITVHLGPHDVPIHLLWDRPVAGIEPVQAIPEGQEALVARGKLLGRIVRRPVQQRWGFKLAPVPEESQQLVIAAIRLSQRSLHTISGQAGENKQNYFGQADCCSHFGTH